MSLRAIVRRALNRRGLDVVRYEEWDDWRYVGYPRASLERRLFYNIGAGSFAHRYWTNVDYGTDYYSQVQNAPFIDHDLMTSGPLPLPDGEAEIFYTSHTIEHVSDGAVATLCREAYRALKPGGVFRLTAPDAELAFAAYERGDRAWWYWISRYSRPGTWEARYTRPLEEASLEQLLLHHYASQLAEIDTDATADRKVSDAEVAEVFRSRPLEEAIEHFTRQAQFNPDRPGNHINYWTCRKLEEFLGDAGFAHVHRSGYLQSRAAPLRNGSMFDNTHPAISLYVEALK